LKIIVIKKFKGKGKNKGDEGQLMDGSVVRPGDIAVAAGVASSPVGADDDEESMDWWTKYFASVDAMIEVIFL